MGSNSAERVHAWTGRALLGYAIVLDLTMLIASGSRSALLWGINLWAYLPAVAVILLFLFPFLFAGVGEWYFRSRPAPEKPGDSGQSAGEPGGHRRGWVLSALILPLVAAPLFWIARDGTHLLGDGLLILKRTSEGILFTGSSVLANRVALWAAALAGRVGGGAEQALAWLSIVMGALFVATAIDLAARLAPGKRERPLAALLFLAQPFLLIFCGYIEFYSINALLTAALILTCLLSLEKKLTVAVPVAVWVISLGGTFLSIVFLPMVGAALFGSYHAKGTKLSRLLPAAGIGVVCGIALLWLAGIDLSDSLMSREGSNYLLPVGAAEGEREVYGLFDPRHFLDLLNETVLVMPLLLFLLPLWMARRTGKVDSATGGLLLTVLFALAPFFLLNPKLGFARDWDLMALPAIPVNLLAIRLIFGPVGGRESTWRVSRTWRFALLFLVALGISRTAGWLYLNHAPDLAIERSRSIAREGRLNSAFARSYLHEGIATILAGRGESRGAYEEARLSEELRPGHPRIAVRTGLLAEAAGDPLYGCVDQPGHTPCCTG